MGGAVSQLEETDWEKADGGMLSDDPTEQPSNSHNASFYSTLDGRPPTAFYQTYCLLKRSVLAQQRTLDVIDSQSNLLYEIRPTPKTLTAFDVYEGSTEQHLLRITTDLARRYWIVSRVGVPAYEGQKEQPQAEDDDEACTKKYYKVACVTVSWSRYLAVAAYYGPPTDDQVEDYKQRQQELLLEQQALLERQRSRDCIYVDPGDATNGDSGAQTVDSASEQANRLRSTSNDPTTTAAEEDVKKSTENGAQSAAENHEENVDTNSTEGPLPTNVDSTLETQSSACDSSPRSEPGHQRSLADSLGESSSGETDENGTIQSSQSMPELEQFKTLFQTTSRYLQKQIVAQGQIYTSGKEYLYKRSLQNKAMSLQDPQRGVIHLDKPLLLCQEIYNKFIGNHQTSRVSKQQALKLLRQDMEQHSQQGMGDFSESVEVDEASEDPMADVVTSAHSEEDEEKPASQPLVGYWLWENTMRTHKMKMHLAKGTDLALHVVMAVLVNQVRYERNAIAMTV